MVSTFDKPVTRERIAGMPRLRLVANFGVGYNNIDLEACRERGIRVTNTPQPVIEPTAELAFALMIYGGQKLGWTDYNIAGVMLILGIVCGLTGKINLNKQAKMMGTGVKNMTNTFLIIGLATTVGTILKGAGNVDTIIKSISSGLSSWPVWLAPAGMMLVIAVINIFVPSATGKIPMLMPILSPLAKLLGVNQQVLTFVYMYGDGFTNYLLPYQSAIAGFVESGRVPFPFWLKFFWKLECIWIVMGAIVVCVAQAINIGPF